MKSPIHPIDGEYITEWLMLGPFFPDDLETDFLVDAGGEANIEPKEGDTVTAADGRTLTWKRYESKGNIINLLDAVGEHVNATAYAFCILQSETAVGTAIRLGSDDGVAVWINGEQVHKNTVYRPFTLDEDAFEVKLKAGANRCLVKISQGIAFWKFAMRILPPNCAIVSGRITDEAGAPIPDAIVRLEWDGLEIVQSLTDASGTYLLDICPAPGLCNLSVTAGEAGDWRLNLHLREGERRTLNLTLKEAISLEGKLMMCDDMTPHIAVPVQAIMVDPVAHPIATTLSDESGRYRFINLKPEQYKVRCQILDGYVYYRSPTNDNGMEERKNGRKKPSNHPTLGLSAQRIETIQPSSPQTAIGKEAGEVLRVERGKTLKGIDFRFAPFKKGMWKNYTFLEGLVSNHVYSIYCDSDGMIWFGTEGGVSRFDGKDFVNLTTEDGLPHNNVWAIHGAPDGNIWFGTAGGVSCYNGKDFVNLTTEDGLPHNSVSAIHSASDGTIWFGTAGGVSRYDGKNFVNLTSEDGLAGNWITDIYCAPNGAMWFGTWGSGVSRYNLDCGIGRDTFTNFTTENGLADNHVAAIYGTPDGSIWFGTGDWGDRGGISVYNGKEFISFTQEDGLVHNSVRIIHRGSDGVMWFGSRGGVSRYDGNQFVNFTQKDGLTHDSVNAIYQDSDEVVWFGTEGGVSVYDDKGSISFTQRDGLMGNNVTAIYRHSDSVMWFGTWGGVCRYDGNQFVNFTQKDGLAHNRVDAIHYATDGAIWFGTAGGVCRYEGNQFPPFSKGGKGGFINFTQKDGLACNSVHAIHRDFDGVMWFGTEGGGASCYDGIAWMSLDTRDGLAGNEVRTIHQDQDGVLWFGTDKGITRYQKDRTSPRARIVAVTTDERYTNLNELKSATVGMRITFEYTSIDFKTSPEKRIYRYKLEGRDSNWQQPTTETEVDYTDLPMGEYTFHVQAINRNLNYSEPDSVTLKVEPLPYQEELRQTREELETAYHDLERALRQTEWANTTIRALAHGLKNEASHVSRDCDAIIQSDVIPNATTEKIQEIKKRLDQMVQNLLKVFEATGEPYYESFDLILVMEVLIARTIEEHPVWRTKIQIDRQYGNHLEIIADAEKIEMAFENLIINACEAMEDSGGVLTIKIATNTNKILVEIQDTGKGIPEADLEEVFRADYTSPDKKKGTGLGLWIAKQIIEEMHQGRLSIRSKEGVGTTVKAELPISQSD